MTLYANQLPVTEALVALTKVMPDYHWGISATQEVVLTTAHFELIKFDEPQKADFLTAWSNPTVRVWWIDRFVSGATPKLPEWSRLYSDMRTPHALLLDEISLQVMLAEISRDIRQGFGREEIEHARNYASDPVRPPQLVDAIGWRPLAVNHAFRVYEEIERRAACFAVPRFEESVVPDLIIAEACSQQAKHIRETRWSDDNALPLEDPRSIYNIISALGNFMWLGQRGAEIPVLGQVFDLTTLHNITGRPIDELEAQLDALTASGDVTQFAMHDLYADGDWRPPPELLQVATPDEILSILHPRSVPYVERRCPALAKHLQMDWSRLDAATTPNINEALGW